MIRTIVSALITLALILGVSIYDIHHVQSTFEVFHETLQTLKGKTERKEAPRYELSAFFLLKNIADG